MPSLRAHMVFLSHLRDRLVTALPEAAQAVGAHWETALVGSEGPDAWYFSGQQRPDTHGLDVEVPQTWPSAIPRWLRTRPDLIPGRGLEPSTAAFVVGYLSHLGLDTWEQYHHPRFPHAARRQAPRASMVPAFLAPERLQAALRALGEAPFPPSRLRDATALRNATVPEGFPAEAAQKVAAGIAPSLPLTDPWSISRINPLRQMVDTPEERKRWEADRSRLTPATPEERQAVLDGALAFTTAVILSWWDGEIPAE